MDGLKIGGLGNGPLLKMGDYQNWSTREKSGFGVKNNKETYIFVEKEDLLELQSYTCRKSGVFRSC